MNIGPLMISVQFSSVALRPHELQHAKPLCPSPTPGVHSNFIESVMPSSRLILCRPLLLPLIPPSIRAFSNESTLRMRWPKHKDIWSLFCKNFTWNIIHKNTELFCCIYETNIVNQVYFLKTILQGIFLTQGLNPGLLHWRQML